MKFLLLNSAESLKLLLEVNLARHTVEHPEMSTLGKQRQKGQARSVTEFEGSLGYTKCWEDSCL